MTLLAGRYDIGDKIGAGGMGDVFRGIDSRTGEPVAIKALKESLVNKNYAVIARFQREAETLRQLEHPNIVKILDAFAHDNQHFIVMEYLPGGSLRDQLNTQGPLPVEQVLAISLELADALTRSHHLNVIHRDIKPENVLLADDGTPRLSDFGVAQIKQASKLTSGEAIVGTFHYLSPEALNGQPLDARTDIWAFGVMLYELLTGIRPFRGERVDQLMKAILMDYPDPDLEVLRPDIPVALVDLIYRMLEKDSNTRIASVRHVGAELEDILHGRTEIISQSRFETPKPNTVVYQRPKHNLPASTTQFVGREVELEEITNMLRDPAVRLVSIVAQGGMGKSRLALEIASHFSEGTLDDTVFTDGVYFVELAPLSAPVTIPTAIAEAIGYQFAGDGRDPKQQLLDFLRNKTMLLVMDNYEHLLDGAGLMTEILQAAPDVQIFATSRERLSLPGETVFYLTGMDFPTWETPEDAPDYAAAQLFLSSARRVQPDFELGEDNLDDVARICRLVEGMPLGILLAASWMAMLSPGEIAAEIEQDLDILEAAGGEVEERHQNIRAVFTQSWDRLTEKEQQVFRQVSVFRGGFSREAVQAVTGADLRTLMSLVNKSLLRRNPSTGRYEIHELLRQYAEEKLSENPDEYEATLDCFTDYFREYLHDTETIFHTPAQLDHLRTIVPDFDNIRAVWQRAVDRRDLKTLQYCARTIYEVAMLKGWYRDGAFAFKAGLDLLEEKTSHLNDYEKFLYLLLQGFELHAGNFSGTHDYQSYLETRQQLYPLLQELGPRPELFITIWFCWSLEDGVAKWQETLAAMRQTGSHFGEGACFLEIAHIARFQADYEKAVRFYERCAEIQHEVGSYWWQMWACAYLDHCWSVLGEYDKAHEYGLRALQIAMKLESVWSIASINWHVSEGAIERSDYEHALIHLDKVIPLLDELDAAAPKWDCWGRNRMYFAQGDYKSARAALDEAIRIKSENDDGFEVNIGYMSLIEGDFTTALKYLMRSLQQILSAHGAWGVKNSARITQLLPGIAATLANLDQQEWALEILSFSVDHPVFLKYKNVEADAIAQLKAELPPDVYEAAWQRGKSLDLDTIVDRLLEDFEPESD